MTRSQAKATTDHQQAVIRIARELHQAGLSSRKIAARLAEQGMYSRAGSVFAPSAILAMVTEEGIE